MTTFLAKAAAKRLLGKKLQDKFGKGDPYYEKVPGTKRNGEPTGKEVRQKRALPPGLSEHDAKVLMRVRRSVHRLDWSLFTICGVGFGWSTVIGIIPGIGDAIDGLMSLSVFRKCCKVEGGLPVSVKVQMMVNVALDFIIGLVPGAEAVYRGNTRNALLLEDFLRERAEKSLSKTDQSPERVHTKGSRREQRGARREESDLRRDERRHKDDITTLDDSMGGRRSTKRRYGRQ